MRKVHDVCTVEGCQRPYKARGYCQTHYAQWMRGSPITVEIKARVHDQPDECTEDGCAEPVKAKGLCKMHYQRLLRHGHTKYRDRKKPAKECMLDGCDSHLYAKGLCHAHYAKQRKWQASGVDAARYQEMLREQGGVCAICAQQETHRDGLTGKPKDLAVDHCHETGAVRALLCSSCNTALGLFNDDPQLLAKAVDYVVSYKRSGIT